MIKGLESLASSDGSAVGASGSMFCTVGIDLAGLDEGDPILSDALRMLEKTASKENKSNIFDWITELMHGSINGDKSTSTGIGNLLIGIIQPDTIKSCLIHAELGIAGAASARVGANLKAQVDIAGGVGVVWERDYATAVKNWLNDNTGSAGNPLRNRVKEAFNDIGSATSDFVVSILGLEDEEDQ